MKALHTLVVGDTGTGKSTLLRQIAVETPATTIWIDHMGSEDDLRAPVARSVADLRTLARDRDVIRYVPTGTDDPALAARSIAHHEIDGPTQIVSDECQEVLTDDSDNQIKQGLHTDRDRGIKWVLATQDPADLPYTPIKQIRYYVWVGEPAMFMDGFLNYYGFDRGDLPDQDFRYAVLDKSGAVIDRGETDPSY